MTARLCAATALVAAALFAVPAAFDGGTLAVLVPAAALGLAAVGVSVLTGRAGLATLGQGAPFAVGAYTTALLARGGVTLGPVQLAAAGLAAAGFALLTGAVVVRARGVTALMITLALGELAQTVAEHWTSVTGGSDGLAGIPAVRLWPGGAPLADDLASYRYAVVVTALATGATALALGRRLGPGLLLDGCREHEVRMRAAGHRPGGYLLGAYVAAGALAGVGGSLLVAGQRYVSPADVGLATSSLVLLAAVLGGVASPLGALAGAVLLVVVRDQLAARWPGHGPLVLGAFFILAVYLLPRGVAGLRLPRALLAEARALAPHRERR